VANGPTVALNTGQPRPVLFTPGTTKIKGSSNYIFMRLSDPSVLKFDATLTYDDGQTETVVVERSNRVKANGQYFLELNDKFTGNLLSVAIQTKANTNSKVTARMCRVPTPINPAPIDKN
jgi:hypothetical protein